MIKSRSFKIEQDLLGASVVVVVVVVVVSSCPLIPVKQTKSSTTLVNIMTVNEG